MMTPEQRGYIAGILDGEGCIMIRRQPKKDRVYYQIALIVQMGHEATTKAIQAFTGVGRVTFVDKGPEANSIWRWEVSNRESAALNLLLQIRPLLITKAEEADVAIEFCNLPRGEVSAATNLVRQSCFERIRDLKPSSRFRIPTA